VNMSEAGTSEIGELSRAPSVEVGRRSRPVSGRLRRPRLTWGLLPIAILVIAWEVLPRIPAFPGYGFFPPFSETVREGFRLIQNGVLLENFASSLVRVLAGFFAGTAVGIGLGILMGWRAKVKELLHPLISLFYPIPAIGWIPLLMLWVGINDLLPIVVIFICSFFPVLYTTSSGVKNVDPSYIRVARSLGASERQVLFTVVIPLALPSIFTGLRLEAGMAWRVLAAAEMIAIPTGIGALMVKAQSLVRMDIIIVCLAVLSIMCFLSEKLFTYLERKVLAKWQG